MTGNGAITTSTLFQRIESWGYNLLPKSHPESLGYGGLLAAIRAQPTKRHFDPESVRLRLADARQAARWVTLGLQTPLSKTERVCPGQVILADRVGKQVHFFVFGGSLEVATLPQRTVYLLQSAGPVLELADKQRGIPDQLFSEVEGLLARWEAAWDKKGQGFLQSLVQIDEFQLYRVCLQMILKRYQESQALQHSSPEFYTALFQERERLVEAGLWPVTPALLETLLRN